MVQLLAEWYDTNSNIKLGRFWFQLQASYMSSHTEQLWYNETVCLSGLVWFLCLMAYQPL